MGPAYTKATLRAAVLRKADATGSDRYDATAGGEVDQDVSDVFDREWKRLLNANRYYQIQSIAATSHATTGRIAKSTLSTGSADTLKRLYRILTIIGPDVSIYNPAEFLEIPLGETFGTSLKVFYQEGDQIMILPKQLSTAFTVWVNYLPPRPADLSTDLIAITFPDEYQNLLVYEGAAWLLSKGGAETKASIDLSNRADLIRTDMLQDLARLTTDPDQIKYPDSRMGWGSD